MFETAFLLVAHAYTMLTSPETPTTLYLPHSNYIVSATRNNMHLTDEDRKHKETVQVIKTVEAHKSKFSKEDIILTKTSYKHPQNSKLIITKKVHIS